MRSRRSGCEIIFRDITAGQLLISSSVNPVVILALTLPMIGAWPPLPVVYFAAPCLVVQGILWGCVRIFIFVCLIRICLLKRRYGVTTGVLPFTDGSSPILFRQTLFHSVGTWHTGACREIHCFAVRATVFTLFVRRLWTVSCRYIRYEYFLFFVTVFTVLVSGILKCYNRPACVEWCFVNRGSVSALRHCWLVSSADAPGSYTHGFRVP